MADIVSQPARPRALVFDLNGTLFPADAAAACFRQLGLPSSAVDVSSPNSGRVPGRPCMLTCRANAPSPPAHVPTAAAPPTLRRCCAVAVQSLCRISPQCPHSASAVQLWFSRVLRDGFAAQLAGSPLPFKHFAAYHLGCLLGAHPAAARCADAAAARMLPGCA